MFDTVHLATTRQFRPDVLNRASTTGVIILPDDLLLDWEAQTHNGRYGPTLVLLHNTTGLQVRGQLHGEVRLQASLPRLLVGHNGSLIRNQFQVHEAITIMWDLANQVLAPGPRTGEFKRVDLVWHLPIPPRKLINILQDTRHPGPRKFKNRWDSTIEFRGMELGIKCYDKERELNGGTHTSETRVEVQITKARKLCQLFGQQSVITLDFNEAYRVYRKILCGFDKKLVSISPEYSSTHLLAWAMHNGLNAPGGEDIFTWWAKGKQKETVDKYRRAVERISYSYHAFHFSDFLPADHPPPKALDVLLRPKASLGKSSRPGKKKKKKKAPSPTGEGWGGEKLPKDDS